MVVFDVENFAMDITRHNLHENFEEILTSIKQCTFMSIDGEFTGLDANECWRTSHFDTTAERYYKIRKGSTDFLLIQFGLCLFHVNEEEQKYEARPYNFYIFRKPYNRQVSDRRFLCQSSSIDFLIGHGFDFNKLFKEGISYLTLEEETKLKTELERKYAYNLSQESTTLEGDKVKKNLVPVPEENKAFLNTTCEQVTKYLDSDESEPLILSPCNAFLRKLIYQMMEEKFPHVHLETVTGNKNERCLAVYKTNDRLKREKEKMNFELMALDIEVGFSKVIRAISESAKLVVGHNMMLDVIHSVNQFHCSLPEGLDDFKEVVKMVFPRLLDTKLMANTMPFKEHILYSSLDEVRLTLQQPPFSPVKIDTAKGFEAYSDSGGSLHEAGYDAFITGCCFATMVKFLGSFQNSPVDFLLPSSPSIQPFINKLFLMKIQDIPYLNLDGPDLEPNREHVFHVTFPRDWKPSDLYSLFEPFGNVHISWLSQTTAFVALHKKELANMVLKTLSQHSGTYHVVSYAFHHQRKSFVWTSEGMGQKRKASTTEGVSPPINAKQQRRSSETELPLKEKEDKDNSSMAFQVECTGDVCSLVPTQKSPSIQHPANIPDSKTEASTKPSGKLFDESNTWS